MTLLRKLVANYKPNFNFLNCYYSQKSALQNINAAHINATLPLKKAHFNDFVGQVDTKYLFEKDKPNTIKIYIDGCCLQNHSQNKKLRKSGVGIYFGIPNHPLNLKITINDQDPTNNRCEILAVHAAIQISSILKLDFILLHSDSLYVINSCETWVYNWIRNGWITQAGQRVKNIDLWKPLYQDLRRTQTTVKFQKVDDKTDCGLLHAHNLANSAAKL